MAVDEYNIHLKKILSEILLPMVPPGKHGMKVIHDPMWGSQVYFPWEIALIDTPLCQRLRQIYQLGTAYLTYPSAVHTRFSHSLGVAALAGRLITRLKEKTEVMDRGGISISRKDIYTVRTTGLLHDVGHCFFSHASEKVLGPIFEKVRKELLPDIKPKPHEFIAYLILNNDWFIEFWNRYIVPLFPKRDHAPNPKEMADIIVGKAPSNKKKFLRDIISGPFDVDKLEYLFRDARTTGLEISYDIERYFYKIRLVNKPEGTYRLVMGQGGTRAIEQIIFSKMMLFSFVYHHQKVLASDALVSDLIDELSHNGDGHIKINHPLDFLKYTDSDIFSSFLDGPTARYKIIKNKIFNRDLPKRCFVLNKEFVNNLKSDHDVKMNWDKLLYNLRGMPNKINKIRTDIVDIIKSYPGGKDVTINDLYVVFPKVPNMDEPAHGPVLGSDGELYAMGDFFDLEGWKKTYDMKKIRGYFYASLPYKDLAFKAVESYLKKKYNLTFNKNARIEAKVGLPE